MALWGQTKSSKIPGDNPPGGLSQRFTFFTLLPTELQFRIWKEAAAAPHIIRLDKHGAPHQEAGLLAACTASRAAYLQRSDSDQLLGGLDSSSSSSSSSRSSSAPTIDSGSGNNSPRPQHGVGWRPELDLVVLDEGLHWSDWGRIAGRHEIRHLAFHYNVVAWPWTIPNMPYTNLKWDDWLARPFPSLRTWELYAAWIDSLDQQAADGRKMTDRNAVWIPPYRGLKYSLALHFLNTLGLEIVFGSVIDPPNDKVLVGRIIFDVGWPQ
ncbi:hypothetical protein PG994_009601 [Apiospora phragmitis]|uniref:2EXR domain-containing protein n=1 Tax=Apiospora phragmitis TaxID=2905665 RepID=A0ABR1U6M2_9PEZI